MEDRRTSHPLDFFGYCPHCGAKGFRADGPRSKHCGACGFTYYFNPAASVAAIITNEKGELLLTRRAFDPMKGTLDLPGGFAELDETLEDALRREIGEELGIEIENIAYFSSCPNKYPFSGFTVHTLDTFFTATVRKGNKRIEPRDDVADFVWVAKEEIVAEEIGLESIRKTVLSWKCAQSGL